MQYFGITDPTTANPLLKLNGTAAGVAGVTNPVAAVAVAATTEAIGTEDEDDNETKF